MTLKKTYDLAFSLGSTCAVSQSLREAGLQFASYPMDWTASPGVLEAAQVVAADFAHWLDADDLKLWDVRHGAGFCTRIYKNMRTGFGFSHEFSDFERFAATYPKVKATYERRIARFRERLESASNVLAVYNELPIRSAAPDETLVRARDVLRAKCPKAAIDLVYFWAEPGAKAPRERVVAEGVVSVGLDYRRFDAGEVTHFVERGGFTAWLRARAEVRDVRDAEDRAHFEAVQAKTALWRWGYGKSAFRRWLNHRAYKLYRSLERFLQKRGMVQKEGPLWFVDK